MLRFGYAEDSDSPPGATPPPRTSCSRGCARIEGQIRGIEGMVEDDRYCIDILTQISAAQAALDKVALGLLDGHAHTCVIGAEPEQQDERTDEMMAAVGRLLRRG